MQLPHTIHPSIKRKLSEKIFPAKSIHIRMEGYAKLASLMGSHPEVAILRRFATLNAQNLLYLQAELVALENDLQSIAAEDCASGDPHRTIYSRDWYTLSQSENRTAGDKRAGKQWQTVLSIRDKLKDYSNLGTIASATPVISKLLIVFRDEALHHQIALTALRPVNPRDLAFLQQWMQRPSMGNVYLLGRDSNIWSETDSSDLIALHARHAEDPFTRWLSDTVVHAYHRAVGRFFRVMAFLSLVDDLRLKMNSNPTRQSGRPTRSPIHKLA